MNATAISASSIKEDLKSTAYSDFSIICESSYSLPHAIAAIKMTGMYGQFRIILD